MPKRTDTTDRVYEYLKGYIDENGKSPELCHIKEHFGFSSLGTVYYHIKRLEKFELIEAGGVRGMKKYSDIKVKGDKMRNLDAFNAMSREGKRNALIDYLIKMTRDTKYLDIWDDDVETIIDLLLDWLYSPAE